MLFDLLNGELTHPFLDVAMPAVTTQENWYPVLIGLWIALIIWGGRRGRIAALLLVIAIALTDQITCSVLKPAFARMRPCNALPANEVRLLVGRSAAYSFPSAHASNSFAMATIVAWRLPRLAPIAFAVAALVAYSRVYVGVHYPLDVVAGGVLGLAVGKLLTWLAELVERRRRRRLLASSA